MASGSKKSMRGNCRRVCLGLNRLVDSQALFPLPLKRCKPRMSWLARELLTHDVFAAEPIVLIAGGRNTRTVAQL